MRLHAAVGAAMSERPEVDVDDLAYQLLAGGDLVDPGLVISATIEAVDRAMTQLVFDHAHELIDRALACSTGSRPAPRGTAWSWRCRRDAGPSR